VVTKAIPVATKSPVKCPAPEVSSDEFLDSIVSDECLDESPVE
jgi:hypothetical protein